MFAQAPACTRRGALFVCVFGGNALRVMIWSYGRIGDGNCNDGSVLGKACTRTVPEYVKERGKGISGSVYCVLGWSSL